jgi:hypothetical protein
LFSDANANSEITTLILNDVTGDAYRYGVVTKAVKKPVSSVRSSGTYAYDIGGKSGNLVSGTLFNVSSGQPTKFTITGSGVVQSMLPLESIDGGIDELTASALTVNGIKYEISDEVFVYKKSAEYSFTILPLQDILNSKEYDLRAYYDKPISSGGRVRVIIATVK